MIVSGYRSKTQGSQSSLLPPSGAPDLDLFLFDEDKKQENIVIMLNLSVINKEKQKYSNFS